MYNVRPMRLEANIQLLRTLSRLSIQFYVNKVGDSKILTYSPKTAIPVTSAIYGSNVLALQMENLSKVLNDFT